MTEAKKKRKTLKEGCQREKLKKKKKVNECEKLLWGEVQRKGVIGLPKIERFDGGVRKKKKTRTGKSKRGGLEKGELLPAAGGGGGGGTSEKKKYEKESYRKGDSGHLASPCWSG